MLDNLQQIKIAITKASQGALRRKMRKETTYKAYDAHCLSRLSGRKILTMPHLQAMNWDYKDQLINVELDAAGNKAYYIYDASGNRTRKVVEKGNVIEERFYIGDYEVFRKTTSGALSVERETIHISDDQKHIAMIDNDGTTETIRYQIDNHLGSASLELDHNADIISYEEYHPFGTTSYRAGRSDTETSLKRYKYVGKERDEETGLYYYGARYYAGWIGRFVSVDSKAKDYPAWSSYVYVLGNPIKYYDPDGNEPRKSQDFETTIKAMGIKEGYTVSIDNETREITIYKREASYAEKSTNKNPRITVRETVFYMNSSGKVDDISIQESLVTAEVEREKSFLFGESVEAKDIKREKGTYEWYNKNYNAKDVIEKSEIDPVVFGLNNLLDSRNADKLFTQSNELPGLSVYDRFENALPSIVQISSIVLQPIAKRDIDTMGLEKLIPKDFDDHTQLNIPLEEAYGAEKEFNDLANKQRVNKL